MDKESLKTASLYINNLLLSRGLLRNGQPIEFARPHKAEGGTEASMAKIINLVHDLILRRDREAEQRETMAMTIRTLKSEETRWNLGKSQLETRNADLVRQLSIAQGRERASKTALRSAEASARSLREEMVRLKATLQQVRTQCANDIRKRDVQIQRLKSHLTTQQRGTGRGMLNSTITIVPTMGGPVKEREREERDGNVESPDYSLRQETTEFLTDLSQSLSDENDNLIGLVRSTLATLREVQGLPASSSAVASNTNENGEIGGEVYDGLPAPADGMGLLCSSVPTSYETLATEMDDVLSQLSIILTNPSFVPIEEVEVREEEIIRLREGWVQMEERWKDAVGMIDGWRKKMMKGSTIQVDELRMSLGVGLGLGAGRTSNSQEGLQEEEEEDSKDGENEDSAEVEAEEPVDHVDSTNGDLDDHERQKQTEAGAGYTDSISIGEEEEEEEEPLGVGLQPDGSVLGELNPNARPLAPQTRKVSFQEVSPQSRSFAEEIDADELDLVEPQDLDSEISAPQPLRLKLEKKASRGAGSRIPRQTSSRQNSSPAATMTIQQKLDTAKAEAEAAEVARKRKAGMERSRPKSTTTKKPSSSRARASRRRSTLSPEELESLMGSGS